MSVGDIKGSRRRFKVQQTKGHAPRGHAKSVADSITYNRLAAARIAKIKVVKK